jgi:PilZ domain
MSSDSPIIPGISFESLRLRSGTDFQIKPCKFTLGFPSLEAQYLSSIRGKMIMVAPVGENDGMNDLEIGKDYILSGFSGQYDFSFMARAMQTFTAPFEYAALAYPASVDARLVRKVERVITALSAIASPVGRDITLDVIIANFSVSGALIDAPAPMGKPGDKVNLYFTVEFEGHQIKLALAAGIRHVTQTGAGRYNIGTEFFDVKQNDKLVLHYVANTYASTLAPDDAV